MALRSKISEVPITDPNSRESCYCKQNYIRFLVGHVRRSEFMLPNLLQKRLGLAMEASLLSMMGVLLTAGSLANQALA